MRLLVVDDDPDYRLLVSLALSGRSEVELVGEVGIAEEAADAAGRLRPDLVLVDLLLAGAEGGAVVGSVHQAAPDAAVVGFADREVGPVGGEAGGSSATCPRRYPPAASATRSCWWRA